MFTFSQTSILRLWGGLWAVLGVIAMAPACGSSSPASPSVPTVNVPFSQTDLVVGTGAEATLGRSITVHYTLWLYDSARAENKGTQVETTVGRTPATLTLASGSLIQGWVQGVPGMKVGGRRRLVVPPALGYGAVQNQSIPPNSTLVFDIELVAVQ